MMQKSLPSFAVVCLLAVAGCGTSSGLPLEDVTGTITRGGIPLEGVMVQFQPVESGRMSFGRTDADGGYSLVFTRDEDGALIGEHRVTLRVPEKQPSEIPGFAEMDLDTQESALHARPVELPTTVTVTDDGENQFNFDVNDLPKR